MVDLSGGPDGPIEHGFSNSVFIIPGLIIFGLSGMEAEVEKLKEPWELASEELERILSGEGDLGLLDKEDVMEELLRRRHTIAGLTGFPPYLVLLCALAVVFLLTFFGWTLYKSLKEKEKKREEKKKLKQKKKK